jgi:Flp pilus assembly protein CpaB
MAFDLRKPKIGRNVLAGAALGVLLPVMALGLTALKKERAAGRCGAPDFSVLPIMIASRDMAAGTPITYESISQCFIPEWSAAPSDLRPDSANAAIGVLTLVPLRAGDAIRVPTLASGMTSEQCDQMCEAIARPEAR